MSSYAKYECLTVEVADKVATVTLNRPQARNAINQKLIRELRTIWDDLADDHAVNAVCSPAPGISSASAATSRRCPSDPAATCSKRARCTIP
ncbi:enoyl-CoA hydratase/isomerase family protein [Bradyrhizobium acaciae]|uniref:enoyl-CoA hydratase/isomerase family protein n=1 Tax=Bradyrhizobium acaciae TaxID=2683706 RepID=UPI001E5A7F96|nr:enoyl-CoA hydratase-related protein [Bradyrhizobium acaciae]